MKQSTYTLPTIKKTYIPKVLLLGNGINKLFGKNSWDELLTEIISSHQSPDDVKKIKQLPYPLQAVVVTEDHLDEKLDELSKKYLEMMSVENGEQSQMLRKFLSCDFDAILTTNYTYEIEQAIQSDFICRKNARSKYRHNDMLTYKQKLTSKEKQYGIYNYMHLEEESKNYNIWHIHGELARPNSMILGHYYYGNLLSLIQSKMSDFIKCCKSKSEKIRLRSWADYFMYGDVYIFGFGLDFSELDLWWLINCKKRNHFGGDIYYIEPNLDEEKNVGKRMLLETYGVKIITEPVKDYKEYYEKMADELPKMITRE